MSASQSLAPRPPASLETIHNILGSLVARYRQEEVLTAVRQIPAREAMFRPLPAWVTSALAEAYRAKGIRELYSHQAATADLVRKGKNVVVVTPTASREYRHSPEQHSRPLCTYFQRKRWLRINSLNCKISRNASTTVSECSRMTAILRAMPAKRFGSAATSS